MSGPRDLFAEIETDPEPHWHEVRAWLQANPQTLLDDRSLLEEIGLKPHGRNVVEFGAAALTRLEEAAMREQDARKQIESIARANFAAQTQTHVAALDLLEARNHSDLARRLDGAAQARFGLAGAVIGIERPGPDADGKPRTGGVPFGWKTLDDSGVDALVGVNGLTWLGENFEGLNLFGPAERRVKSVALIRMAPVFPGDEAPRHALCAFGSSEPEGFTAHMGCELVAFIARVVERTAERWPIL